MLNMARKSKSSDTSFPETPNSSLEERSFSTTKGKKKRKLNTSSAAVNTTNSKKRKAVTDVDIKDAVNFIESKKNEWMQGGHPATPFLQQLSGIFGMTDHTQFFDTTTFDSLCRKYLQELQSKKEDKKNDDVKKKIQAMSEILEKTETTINEMKNTFETAMTIPADVCTTFTSFFEESTKILEILNTAEIVQPTIMMDKFDFFKSNVKTKNEEFKQRKSESENTGGVQLLGNPPPPLSFGNTSQLFSGLKFRGGFSSAKTIESSLDNELPFFKKSDYADEPNILKWCKEYSKIHPVLFPTSPFVCSYDNNPDDSETEISRFVKTSNFVNFTMNEHVDKLSESIQSNSDYNSAKRQTKNDLIYPVFSRNKLLFSLWLNLENLNIADVNDIKHNLYSKVLSDFTTDMKNTTSQIKTDFSFENLENYCDFVLENMSSVHILDGDPSDIQIIPNWLDQAATRFLSRRVALEKITKSQKRIVLLEHLMSIILSQASPMYLYFTVMEYILSEFDIDDQKFLKKNQQLISISNILGRVKTIITDTRSEFLIPEYILFTSIGDPEFSSQMTVVVLAKNSNLDDFIAWKYKSIFIEKRVLPFILCNIIRTFVYFGLIEVNLQEGVSPVSTTASTFDVTQNSSANTDENSIDVDDVEEEEEDQDMDYIQMLKRSTPNLVSNQNILNDLKKLFYGSLFTKKGYTENSQTINRICEMFTNLFTSCGHLMLILQKQYDVYNKEQTSYDIFVGDANLHKKIQEKTQLILQSTGDLLKDVGDLVIESANPNYDKGSNKKVFTQYQKMLKSTLTDSTSSVSMYWTAPFVIKKLVTNNVDDMDLYGPTNSRKFDSLMEMDEIDDQNDMTEDDTYRAYFRGFLPLNRNDINEGSYLTKNVGEYVNLLTTKDGKNPSSSIDTLMVQTQMVMFQTITRLLNTLILMSSRILTSFEMTEKSITKKIQKLKKIDAVNMDNTVTSMLTKTEKENLKDLFELSPKEYWILQVYNVPKTGDYLRLLENRLPIRINNQIISDAFSTFVKIKEYLKKNFNNYNDDDSDNDINLTEIRNAKVSKTTLDNQFSGPHGFVYSRNTAVLSLFANGIFNERTQAERVRPVGQPYVQKQAMVWLQVREQNVLDFLMAYAISVHPSIGLKNIQKKGVANITSFEEEMILGAFKFIT